MEKKRISGIVCAIVLILILALIGAGAFVGRNVIAYEQALSLMKDGQYTEAAMSFTALGTYMDAPRYAVYCRAMAAGEEGSYSVASANLLTLGDLGDSSLQAVYYAACHEDACGNYEKARELFFSISLYRDAAEKAAEMTEKANARDYARAKEYLANQEYQLAAVCFDLLGNYLDSVQQAAAARAADQEAELSAAYARAEKLYVQGSYSAAAEAFLALGDYLDSAARADQARTAGLQAAYDAALACEQDGRLQDAMDAFLALGDFSDSAAQAERIRLHICETAYQAADSAEAASSYITAYDGFTALGAYKDSAARASAIRQLRDYAVALENAEYGSYSSALHGFLALGDFSDSAEKARVLSVSDFSALRSLGAGLASIRLDDLYGLLNVHENLASAPYWDQISTFNSFGLARVEKDGGYGYINLQGQLVIPCIYLDAFSFDAQGMCRVRTERGWGYIDVTGQEIIPCQYAQISVFSGEICTVLSRDNHLGLMNRQGQMVLPPDYTILGSSTTGRRLSSSTVLEPVFDANGLMQLSNGKAYGLVNTSGELMGEICWDSIYSFQEGLYRVKSGKKYGFINTSGEVVIKAVWEEAGNFHDGLASVKSGKKYGFINTSGEMVIPAIYDEVTAFADGLAAVRMNETGWLIIDKTGKDLYFDVVPYKTALKALEDGDYEAAYRGFEALGKYGDAQTMLQETTYRYALSLIAANDRTNAAALLSGGLRGYKDSDSLSAQLNADALFDQGQYAAAWSLYAQLDAPYHSHDAEYQTMYDSAAALLENAGYDEAISAFTALGSYSDSVARIQQAYDGKYAAEYQQANTLLESGEFDTAEALFRSLGDYSKAQEMVSECRYRKAAALAAAGKTADAAALYAALGTYRDSQALRLQLNADALFAKGEYGEAYAVYSQLDAAYHTHADDYTALYAQAGQQRDAGAYADAAAGFAALGGYSDAAAQAVEMQYQHALSLAAAGKYTESNLTLSAITTYKDSASLIIRNNADAFFAKGQYSAAYDLYATLDAAYHTHADDYAALYANAEVQRTEGKYDDAAAAFSALGKYSDAAAQVTETKYQQAASLAAKGEYSDANTLLKGISDYKDSTSLIVRNNADAFFAKGQYSAAYDLYATLDAAYHTHADDYAALYASAEVQRTEGKYDDAAAAFSALGKYSDAAAQVTETKYQQAVHLADAGSYKASSALLTVISSYKDSATLIKRVQADEAFSKGQYADAYAIYITLPQEYHTHTADYASLFSQAEALQAEGRYDEAYDLYASLGSYPNVAEKLLEVGVDKAAALYARSDFLEAAAVYDSLGDLPSAQNARYQHALTQKQAGQYAEASSVWLALGDYSDSRQQNYRMGVELAASGKLAEALTVFQGDVEYADAREQLYLLAQKASAQKRYDVSVSAYTLLGSYKDSGMSLTMDTYAYGEQLYEGGQYDRAAEVFASMNGFSNTEERAKICKYAAAKEELEKGNFTSAKNRFLALGQYSDSAAMAKEADYRAAAKAFSEQRYEDALTMYLALNSYSQSKTRVNECRYAIGEREYNAGKYAAAIEQFATLKSAKYRDSETRWLQARYAQYDVYLQDGQYDKAITGFEALGDYSDSVLRAQAAHYMKAKALDTQGKVRQAYDEYVLAQNIADAKQQVRIHAHTLGQELYLANKYTEAVEWYEIADGYSDAHSQLYKIGQYFFSTQDYLYAMNAFKTLAGYEDVSDCLHRIGQYYEMLPDEQNAYLAYGFAGDYKDAAAKVQALAKSLHDKADKLLDSGKYSEADQLYYTLAKIDPAYVDDLNMSAFLQKMRYITKITFGRQDGSALTWTRVGAESGKMILVSEKSLAKLPMTSSRTNATTVSSWMKTAPFNLFTAEERDLATIWIMSKSEVEKYLPTENDRRVSGVDYVWTSTNNYSSYYVTYASGSTYMNEYGSKTSSYGVRPGMKLALNRALYDLITAPNSGYKLYNSSGKAVTFDKPYAEGKRIPMLSELDAVQSTYTVSSTGYTYGFKLNNGYYVSQNRGKSNSYAMCKLTFTSTTGYIYLDCINYAESGDDYGMVSKLDTSLALSSSADNSSKLFKTFRNISSSSVQTIIIPVPDDTEHTIYIKFIKDYYSDLYNDSLQFKVRFE
ncbi:MAG: WG repeat-containing protein [Clostridia bacterium]|nr:WG repeat-containing protein [Clostridia bacterium]